MRPSRAIALLTFPLVILVGCGPGDPTFTQSVPAYPKLFSSPIDRSFIVIKCQFPDSPSIPNGLNLRIDMLLTSDGTGFGSIPDYYSDTSYGAVSLAKSVVHPSLDGWYKAPFTLAGQPAFKTKYGGGARFQRILQCANATPDNVDFSKFYGVIVVLNQSLDAGAGAVGQAPMQIHGKTFQLAAVELDPGCLSVKCGGHEVGHGLGLVHSYDTSQDSCGASPGEVCDPWDIMSWGFSFLDPNFLYPAVGGQPSAGPGLNVPNLLKEGWIPKDRIIAIGPRPRRADQVTLAALSHPTAPGMLTVELLAGGRTSPTFYTVEYRQQDGWDKAMPNNAVVIHSYLSAATGGTPYSYLQRISNEGQRLCFTNPEQCQFLSGQTWVEPSNAFKLTVNSIDPSTGTANLTIGP